MVGNVVGPCLRQLFPKLFPPHTSKWFEHWGKANPPHADSSLAPTTIHNLCVPGVLR